MPSASVASRLVALACTAATALAAIPAVAQTPPPPQIQLPPRRMAPVQTAIRFAARVPIAGEPLPIFRLAPNPPPARFVRAQLALTKARLQPEGNTLVARDPETQALRAYLDPRSGDATIVPDLKATTEASAQAQALSPERALSIARRAIANPDFLPRDATAPRLGPPIPLMGGSGQRTGVTTREAAPPSQRLIFVPVLRSAAGLPVYGPGSRAALALGNDGSVRGLVRRWKSAVVADRVKPTASAESVTQAIRTQLRPFSTAATAITVDRIVPAYYNGAGYLQPVFYFTATLHPLSSRAADERVGGYVPMATPVEEIPALDAQPQGPRPTEGQRVGMTGVQFASYRGTGTVMAPSGPTVTLGEYANRDGAMLGMANELLDGFNLMSGFFPKPGQIVRTQWYWAEPWEVVGPSSKTLMNGVNIAYTQPHGNWYYNTTLSNNANAWDVHDIGTGGNPGFGAAAGGKLATWIIDSCEVAPAFQDQQVKTGNGYDAFTPWWPVFQGLHNVLAFRTEMWLFDGLNVPFGFIASLGADVNAAWFQEIAADPSYNDGYTYLDGNINQTVHMGRASTFIDARNLGHSIYDVAPQSASSTLWNFWMGN